jgi:hypothetical protein
VYRIGEGSITARNIDVESLAAITANLGIITDGQLQPDADSFWNLDTGEFRVGNTRSYEDANHNGNDDPRAEYLHYKPGTGFFQKIKNFFVSTMKSVLWGEFRILRTNQDIGGTPTFHSNPGSAAGKEATEVRGAFRVRTSTEGTTAGDTVNFEVTPNRHVTVPGFLNSASFLKTFKTIDLYGLNENTYYPVTAPIVRHKGFFEVIVDVQLSSGTKPSWSTHANGFSCFQHMLVLPSGWGTIPELTLCLGRTVSLTNNDSVPPVGWSQMRQSSTAVLWLRGGGRYNVWDSANAGWTIRTAAYTASNQTVQPQMTQVFDFVYSTVYANLSALLATMASARVTDDTDSTSPTTGALTVAGGVGIGKDLYVGGAALITIGSNTCLRPIDNTVKPLYLGSPGLLSDKAMITGVYAKAGYFNELQSSGDTYLSGYVYPRTNPTASSFSLTAAEDYKVTIPRGWYVMSKDSTSRYGRIEPQYTDLGYNSNILAFVGFSGPSSGAAPSVISSYNIPMTLYYLKY